MAFVIAFEFSFSLKTHILKASHFPLQIQCPLNGPVFIKEIDLLGRSLNLKSFLLMLVLRADCRKCWQLCAFPSSRAARATSNGRGKEAEWERSAVSATCSFLQQCHLHVKIRNSTCSKQSS